MPYATVILPTLDRWSTLNAALGCVRAQSVRDIEILVVLDGGHPQCRDITRTHARADDRIRVLDRPKSPDSGEGNVHDAVLEAKSERIFYTDDDDLLLPEHVAMLGPALDQAEIADSRVVSLDRYGGLYAACVRPGQGRGRDLLASYTYKYVFDTHVAHRRSAYLDGRGWLPRDPDSSRPVWDFLAKWARDPAVRWASLDEATAISLHGRPRSDMSSDARRAEIEAAAASLRAEGLPLRIDSVGALSILVRSCPADRGEEFAAYLARHEAYADIAEQPDAAAYFDCIQGRAPCLEDISGLIDTLVRPKLGDAQLTLPARVLRSALPLKAVEHALRRACEVPDRTVHLRRGALASWLWQRGAQDEAVAQLETALGEGDDPRGCLSDLLAKLRPETG